MYTAQESENDERSVRSSSLARNWNVAEDLVLTIWNDEIFTKKR